MLRKSILILSCMFTVHPVSQAQSTAPQMYLCIDSMLQIQKNTGKKPVKMVYGYINGKKTECMSEYSFKAKYYQTSFINSCSTQPDSQKLLEARGLKVDQSKISLIDLVYRGKKDLAGADLSGYDLAGLDLSNADLRYANLSSSDLRNTNLSNAKLQGANLEYAYLKNANLHNANITDSNLKGAYFQRANLTTTKGATLEIIRMVTTVFKARLTKELTEQINDHCPAKFKDPEWRWQTAETDNYNYSISESSKADRKRFH